MMLLWSVGAPPAPGLQRAIGAQIRLPFPSTPSALGAWGTHTGFLLSSTASFPALGAPGDLSYAPGARPRPGDGSRLE